MLLNSKWKWSSTLLSFSGFLSFYLSVVRVILIGILTVSLTSSMDNFSFQAFSRLKSLPNVFFIVLCSELILYSCICWAFTRCHWFRCWGKKAVNQADKVTSVIIVGNVYWTFTYSCKCACESLPHFSKSYVIGRIIIPALHVSGLYSCSRLR